MRMTRIDIDARTWSSVRAVCIEHGLEVPELLGTIVKQTIDDLPRLKKVVRETVQNSNRAGKS